MGMPFSKSVNDFVARAAGTVNAVVAVAIMGIGVLVGLVGLLTTVTAPRSERFLMVVVIPLGAVLLTVLLCGFLAVLQNIRDLLAELLEETRARTKRGAS